MLLFLNKIEGSTQHLHFIKNGREGCVRFLEDLDFNHENHLTEFLTNK